VVPDAAIVANDDAAAASDAAPVAQADAEPVTQRDAANNIGIDAVGAFADAAVLDDASTATGLEPGPGDLVIVEIQGNPQTAADNQAEYIELINVSGRALDLEGCRLTHREYAGAGSAPVMSVGNHRINRSVPVAPGDRVLLTRSNGGYFGTATQDYVYSTFELANGGADANRVRLMVPTWSGMEPPDVADIVDEVTTPTGTFENDLRGRAWQLNPTRPQTTADNDDPTAWCYAEATMALAYWNQNWGTPRAANVCP